MNDHGYQFDRTKSILLGDYLDLILNAVGQENDTDSQECPKDDSESQGDIVLDRPHPETKFRKYEKIIYSKTLTLPEIYTLKATTPRSSSDPTSSANSSLRTNYDGGILLPEKKATLEDCELNNDGSGNIVIIGEPGVGKSTLAFQIAAACTSTLNHGIAVYYSIDISRSQLIKSMCFDSKNKNDVANTSCWNRMISLQDKDANDSDKHLLNAFRAALQKKDRKIIPQILFPMLSPRGISHDMANAQELFSKRFAELELMLRAVTAHNDSITAEKNASIPMVKLIVIDSINMLGEMPLTREQIGRVFELFENYGIIGLFTLGENTAQTDLEAVNSATILYIADVAIHMKREEHNNYTCMAMTVVKSRFVKPLLGAHPYKIVEADRLCIPGNKLGIRLKKYVNVMPTLHDIIPGTERSADETEQTEICGAPDSNAAAIEVQDTHRNPPKSASGGEEILQENNLFGIPVFNIVLPDHFNTRKGKSTKTIALTGDNGLFKSDLAVNALISGLLENEPQTGLIIRMSDRDNFANGGARLEESVLKKLWLLFAKEPLPMKGHIKISINMPPFNMEIPEKPVKRSIRGWELSNVSMAYQQNKDAHVENSSYYLDDNLYRRLIEITFKSGALLPEEFISDILMLVVKHNVKRIAFSDIKYIGTSYPFLVDSGTSGTLFISAFIHIMRNYGVDVIISSSTTEYEPSNDEMKKAVVLSDAVLKFDKDGGHATNVIISGEGQMIHNKKLRIDVLDKSEGETPDIDCMFITGEEKGGCRVRQSSELKAFRIVQDQ